MKKIASKGDQESGGSINDYIKGLIEGEQFDYEVAWKKNASLVIDLIPVVGDAKGIIECVVGKDLITGRELSGLERGLCFRQDSIDTDLFFTKSNVNEILAKIKNGTYKIDTPDNVLNVKRSLTDEFKNRYSKNLTTVQRARLWQGDWGYYGIVQNYVPDFEQALREGKIVPLLDTDTINNLEGKKVWIRSLGKELEVTFEPAKLLEKDASGNYKYATICSVGDSIKADGNAIVLDNKYIVNDISTLTKDEFTKYGKNGLDIDNINKEIGLEFDDICKIIGEIRGGMQ